MVNDYEFDGEGGADDTVIMSMARGTMRTITGIIGDGTGDTYEMNTPFASIGVRGTEYGVVVDRSGRMRVVVFDGTITASTPQGGGFAVLGLGAESDAAEIDADATITPLSELPADLRAVVSIVIEAVTGEQVNALPSDAEATEAARVQQNLNAAQAQADPQANIQGLANAQDAANAAGAFIDADGNVIQATTETETNNAQRQIVVTINQKQPGSFDIAITVSPSQ